MNSVLRHIPFLIVLLWFWCCSFVPKDSLFAQDIQSNREQEYAANKIVAQSDDLAQKGEFRNAVLKLIPIVDYYPEYTKIDQVLFRLGNHLTEIGLYDAAFNLYKHLITNHVDSPQVPFVLFRIEKLYYLQENYERAIDYFRILR